MYSTCIFCLEPLGANEAVEHFPVGRRLAFDAAGGRLWVVCRACERWNLSPLEERWEAIEECERRFRDTRLRVSTENVGLARLAEGTELVRIGRPLRPEFAAWRYGDQFGGRARRTLLNTVSLTGLGLGVAGAMATGLPFLAMAGLPLAVGIEALKVSLPRGIGIHELRHACRLIMGDDRELRMARLLAGEEYPGGWGLEVITWKYHPNVSEVNRRHLLTDRRALHVMAVILAHANSSGGTRRQVQEAVRRIERAGDPTRYLAEAAERAHRSVRDSRHLWAMPLVVRLALEMATHEDAERRAMEGELAELERQWKEAEEIAAIADHLAISPTVEKKLDRMRGKD